MLNSKLKSNTGSNVIKVFQHCHCTVNQNSFTNLNAVSEHDVLVLAVVRLLLPDVLGLLQDPLHRLLLPLPPIAVLLEVGADGEPGTEDGTEETA